jgi:glycine/D-amino acid oxidase-like deaminating enzyme
VRLDRCDAVVVGGGILGVTAAYFLQEFGLDVVLLEARELGFGASGRNLGFLGLQCRERGPELTLARAGVALYESTFLPLLGPTFGYRRSGGMIYFVTERQAQVFEAFALARAEDGVHVEVLDGDAVRRELPLVPDNVLGATFCPEDGKIEAGRFVRRLGRTLTALGVRVYEHTAATRLLTANGRVGGVETVAGTVIAELVVVTAGVWTRLLWPAAPISLEHLGALRTAPVPYRVEPVLYGPGAVAQYPAVMRVPGFNADHFAGSEDYWELVAQDEDGSLLVGCPVAWRERVDLLPTAVGLHRTLEVFLYTFPSLREIGVAATWAGLLPRTPDGLPIVDEIPGLRGGFVATGHTYGNVMGPISGKLVAEMATGRASSLSTEALALSRLQ